MANLVESQFKLWGDLGFKFCNGRAGGQYETNMSTIRRGIHKDIYIFKLLGDKIFIANENIFMYLFIAILLTILRSLNTEISFSALDHKDLFKLSSLPLDLPKI